MQLKVIDMTCMHCEMKIKNALKEVGAENVVVDLKNLTVDFDLDKGIEVAKEAIMDVGYTVVD